MITQRLYQNPLIKHNLKILVIYLIGYFLASHYRPFQNKNGFYDFGIADSGLSMGAIIFVYLVLTPPYKSISKAKTNALTLLFIYLSQEIYCCFFPGFVGTFDYKDIFFCLCGFGVIYWGDVLRRDAL
mgnify:CR=1 FL=1